jgi:hypothetical protein
MRPCDHFTSQRSFPKNLFHDPQRAEVAADIHEDPLQMPLPVCPRQRWVNPSTADVN